MLLVNNPGSWGAIYAPLAHAEWHGWTPTDLIFPFFLFVVGITTELSRKSAKGILRRGAIIVLLGLALNAFPFYWWGKMEGEPTFVDRVLYRFEHLRFMGVLQRIGIVYAITALIAMKATRRQMMIIAAAILIAYAAILMQGPFAPPEATIAAKVDRATLGEKHIWSSTKTWDPEGPLSTLPAIGTCLLGVLAAPLLRSRKLVLYGIAGIIAGLLWDRWFPINKNLWTSSYVLFTAGCACVLLALFVWVIDERNVRGWARPFVIYGVNPMVAFVGSGMMARVLSITKWQSWTYREWFAPFIDPPKLASLSWALAFVLLWLGILWLLWRRGIVLKV